MKTSQCSALKLQNQNQSIYGTTTLTIIMFAQIHKVNKITGYKISAQPTLYTLEDRDKRAKSPFCQTDDDRQLWPC